MDFRSRRGRLRRCLRPHRQACSLYAPFDPGMWDGYGPGAVGVGWDLGLMGLELHLERGGQVDRSMAVTFPASPEGREFIRLAAAGWADAAIKDGEEAGKAREAAARTVAFFTPPEATPGH